MRGRFRGAKRLLFHFAVRLLQLLSTVLPRRAALAVFAGIGDAVRLLDRAAVRRSLSHLDIAWGNALTAREKCSIVRGMFRETGRNLVDLLRIPRMDPEAIGRLVTFEGLEHLDAALARGRGVVAITGHLGNWEVLGAALVARGYPVTVVAREIFDARSDRLLNRWRRQWGVDVIARGRGLLPVVRALRHGAVLGALVDQDTAGPSLFADFFGRPARTPLAPFLLARRTGAPLVPMWIHLDESGIHRARILPEIAPSGAAGTAPEGLREDMERWHRILEAAIREHPSQWVWHHRRWKTRPSEGAADLRDLSRKSVYPKRFQRSREAVLTR